ncbi:hypothetical protein B0I35DRAFT_486469 [Stachybotrys elegans]|uniref:T6SS Phospholipase effector Tle1-like catalytic domain-containing protein n=1 Tax=Stachybotrys elegans TaxID=80388 RepID=A0A8K0T1D4_9HYPO|nr:hypothetical protein B0I35DRAFT_486469 [Stachybotrys elegans]
MAANGKPTVWPGKRLIVCCDGTWQNGDNGYSEPSILNPKGELQVPSNVTRIARLFKLTCSDGKQQIISYESGVGTGSNMLDTITGGAFGLGLSERVRESYSFVCSNYVDGDEIFLVGFSRGAFTVRTVAGMIGDLGLLTREGLEHFYAIFRDLQHWQDDDYKDPFPNVPFPDKPKGPNAADEYRARLEKLGYTRVTQKSGELIKIKAVCVWDTVGSLGVPRWHDTNLSDRIEHAFHALALDETRGPYSPAVWERLPANKHTTDLRQVWFPGGHGNCGGGSEDQGLTNLTLTWMMDQMASIGVEFDTPSLDRIFNRTAGYYGQHDSLLDRMRGKKWAVDAIYDKNKPIRPWGLATINQTMNLLYRFTGLVDRTPGMYRQTNPKTGREDGNFLVDTNERIHSSVRVRLACKGLGIDDRAVWTAPALSSWKLKTTDTKYEDPVPRCPSWDPCERQDDSGEGENERWIWEYAGSESSAPLERILVEEPLGPYERYCLAKTGGEPNVFAYASKKSI